MPSACWSVEANRNHPARAALPSPPSRGRSAPGRRRRCERRPRRRRSIPRGGDVEAEGAGLQPERRGPVLAQARGELADRARRSRRRSGRAQGLAVRGAHALAAEKARRSIMPPDIDGQIRPRQGSPEGAVLRTKLSAAQDGVQAVSGCGPMVCASAPDRAKTAARATPIASVQTHAAGSRWTAELSPCGSTRTDRLYASWSNGS